VGALRGSKDRHLVPRWRSVRRTIEAGEFQQLATPKALSESQVAELEKLQLRWEVVQTPLAAAELVGAQLVAGEFEEALEPAKTLWHSSNSTHRALARRALSLTDSVSEPDPPEAESSSPVGLFRSKVRASKARATRDARNPIAWADLARRYTALGQFEPAQKSLRIARALAPDSRYILRSAARFYIHIGEPGMAAHLLEQSPRSRDDPWLMAALLSATSLASRPLPGRRVAHRILDSGRFRPIENSDLISELGTLELKSGDDRRARKLFRESLQTPTDNSLAQGEWASHKLTNLDIELDTFDVPFAAEAMARDAAQRAQWQLALAESVAWLDDQPFDSEAAVHASYVAAVGLDDWDQSRMMAEIGLRANPSDATLANNLAYALIESGRIAEALAPLKAAASTTAERSERIAVLATTGLLAFRQGDVEEGRRLYGRSIELAKRLNDHDAEAMARAMLAREEIRTGNLERALELVAALRAAATRVRDSGVLRCVERTNGLVEITKN
jgi:tetratricopeptide (TPR) repeat protein